MELSRSKPKHRMMDTQSGCPMNVTKYEIYSGSAFVSHYTHDHLVEQCKHFSKNTNVNLSYLFQNGMDGLNMSQAFFRVRRHWYILSIVRLLQFTQGM